MQATGCSGHRRWPARQRRAVTLGETATVVVGGASAGGLDAKGLAVVISLRLLGSRRSALTMTETLFICGCVLNLIILLPAFGPHLFGPKPVCSAQLRDIGRAMVLYAEQHSGALPSVSYDESMERISYLVLPGGGAGTAQSPDRTMPTQGSVGGTQELSITRLYWSLIRVGLLTPRQLVCPNSADDWDPVADTTACFDFAGYGTVSYGLHVPFRQGELPAKYWMPQDGQFAIGADKGPYSDASIAAPPPGMSPAESTSAWRPFNSSNHAGVGQNVLFADLHVSFYRTPLAGIDQDNIYTIATDATQPGRWCGESPWLRGAYPRIDYAPDGTPLPPRDSMIFP